MSDGQTPECDSIYNDPSASTTLVSSDEVHFRVDPYPLKKGSTVLRDMLSDPDLTPSPIPLDLPSDELRTLLSFLDLGKPNDPTSIAGWKRLLETGDKFDCQGLKMRIQEHAQLRAFDKPWETFSLASHLNDTELAKHSLKLMAEDVDASVIRLEYMPPSLAQQASMPYLLGLFKALMLADALRDGTCTTVQDERSDQLE
ncbi:hypothetical protein I203_106225 [Kwoniella mangroviensis CBS 8507]|uniref:uncharacterized protein n=1 Tax=Kwoniella mangroviensis CBS 8507 TaxID=1296122 RepID=UPI00080D225A|nr:uncharacterized protein I203_04699 [Kwoniella mangroviensis CBS 8507]OCF66368.1 hypothetical protein I203_04699 [Kwoniella mangroviensis CBS 8507]